MSDPVTNFQSADLLSSLRRLVAVGPSVAPIPDSGRLVLTPSFRVAPETLVLESPVPTSAASLAATIKELEAALGVTPGDWEPDGSETAAPAHTWPDMQPLAFRPLPRAADAGALASDAAATPEPAAEPPFQSVRAGTPESDVTDNDDDLTQALSGAPAAMADDLTVDETALRAIVADVLRQELQGELGERITRNVRKLVRREIYRVLNSDELR